VIERTPAFAAPPRHVPACALGRAHRERGDTAERAAGRRCSFRGLCLALWAAFACLAAYAQPGSRTELAANWQLISAREVAASGAAVSQPSFGTAGWHPIRRMPATVLEVLEEDGVYPNLYYGMNLLTEVPQDLYKQDWWYRTTFHAPSGQGSYWLEFPGINYRADIWLNGRQIATGTQIAGMYAAHTLNVTDAIRPGADNVLAVKVTPERAIQDVNGVELADSWFDWINWKYLGYHGPRRPGSHGISFVADRNAGIWKPVYLHSTGALSLSHPLVNSDLPLPRTDSATLTVYADVTNSSTSRVRGMVTAEISRSGKPGIHIEQSVAMNPGETREVVFDPSRFPQLRVLHPDLWWPYTIGKPNLYQLKLQTSVASQLSDSASIRFGIRKITQLRDTDEQFPEVGKGGNFYLQVNGRNYLIRGADYTPDLLYKYDPEREAAQLGYVKDLGLNLLRWESKISSEHIIDLADEEGIPLMFGWMCCNQWENWDQWSAEDQRVAGESLRSQINMLRSHAAVFIWANGSDGLPPPPIRAEYHHILASLHWNNAVVDTVSSFAKGPNGEPEWSGIHMQGPYSWRPPSYWFSGRYAAARGSCAEQGDNEHIPPYESLQKFIPPDKLWPINQVWYFHSGSNPGNNTLANVQRAIDRRYGPSANAEEFAWKAQLAHYENTRAQFEDFAANGWANHKMTMYWMLNSQWPSFFGHIYDYYLKPGGAYFGAKKGLRPLSVVFDYYATGDHSRAFIRLVNQTPDPESELTVRTRIYDLAGHLRYDRQAKGLRVSASGVTQALIITRLTNITPVYFVRCQLLNRTGTTLVDNVYWQSTTLDDLGSPANDSAFDLQQASWANFTTLPSMPTVALQVHGALRTSGDTSLVSITLQNPTPNIAFFERVEITAGRNAPEVLPITYDDNYVTVFPGESVTVKGRFRTAALGPGRPWWRLRGENTPTQAAELR
jgi:exo-1,4-beta-D-glucosaminidase